MRQLTTNEWITQFLSADPPRSKSLVMTIFGDTVAAHGGAAWLGSMIGLLAPFGVNDRLVRTSVFRLVQEGWLVARRDGRRSAYAILPSAQARFARANRRIYTPLATDWDGDWTLLFAGASAMEQAERLTLRKELLWEGFALVAPGVFAHPLAEPDLLGEILARAGAQDRLFVCRAGALPGVPARPLRALAEGWDLADVTERYARFSAQFGPLLDLLEHGAALASEQAFMMRTLLIHAYRRVQLHDPMLPVELLPQPWPGSQAYALARALYRRTYALAETFAMTVLRSEDAQAPEADSAFYERFGGLR